MVAGSQDCGSCWECTGRWHGVGRIGPNMEAWVAQSFNEGSSRGAREKQQRQNSAMQISGGKRKGGWIEPAAKGIWHRMRAEKRSLCLAVRSWMRAFSRAHKWSVLKAWDWKDKTKQLQWLEREEAIYLIRRWIRLMAKMVYMVLITTAWAIQTFSYFALRSLVLGSPGWCRGSTLSSRL